VTKIKRVFLLSHCDDEIFLLPLLLDSLAQSTIVFFTTRKNIYQSPDVRRLEAVLAKRFLSRFQKVNTIFLSPEIHDGLIHEEFKMKNFEFLESVIVEEKPDEIITLAFEGGHQDHDSVNVIARILCDKLKIDMVSCPAYRSANFSRKLFTVMKSDLTSQKIRVKRLRTLTAAFKIMFIYKSQFKTWVGLAPFILFKYSIYPFSYFRVKPTLEVVHLDRCFYESRNRAVQSEVLSSLRRFANFRERDE
jgi:LmbE family N-acetylglucosaminyl deacetylase